jgi:hypothetical protein
MTDVGIFSPIFESALDWPGQPAGMAIKRKKRKNRKDLEIVCR